MKKTGVLLTAFILLWGLSEPVAAAREQTVTCDRQRQNQSELPRKKQIWYRLQKSFDLDVGGINGAVASQLKLFTAERGNGVKEVERWLSCVEPFIYYVVEELASRRMPLELALLPVVESQYDPFALSKSKAHGMWQFIPSTARAYGLKSTWWYSGSRDLRDSTDAALNYLSDLYEDADGDWLKALAGYNAGWSRVNRHIIRNQRSSLPVTFWDLAGDLPQETQDYVPRFVALIHIIKNPKKYGVNLPPIANSPYFKEVHVHHLDLPKAAELASVPLNDLYYLNAGLRRWATPPQGPHELLVPVAAVADFSETLASLSFEERFGWVLYEVQKGDNLTKLSKRFSTSVEAIRMLNGKDWKSRIYPGDKLIIPSPLLHYSRDSKSKYDSHDSDVGQIVYTVESGDSLWRIANKYGIVPYNKIRSWNPHLLKNKKLQPGQQILLWVPGKPVLIQRREPVIRRMFYSVSSGDSLSKIAKKYDINAKDLERWNSKINGDDIYPGDVLLLYVDVDQPFTLSAKSKSR